MTTVEKNDKICQYISNLIFEYWEPRGNVPREPKKILLAWVGHIMAFENRRILSEILSNLDLIYEADFMDANVFAHFLYYEVFHSPHFKMTCDVLRDKENSPSS